MREPYNGGWDWEEPEPDGRELRALPSKEGTEKNALRARRRLFGRRDDLPPEKRRRAALLGLAGAAALVALAVALAVSLGRNGEEQPEVAPHQPSPQPVAVSPPSPPEAPPPPAESLFKQGTTLRPGDSGNTVRELQRALRRLGFNVSTADGNYGPRTEEAVRRFQESRDLVVDGIAGTATLAAVEEALAEKG